jgi:hypothetical protein
MLFGVALTAGAALAQAPAELFEKAPPEIDDALRARVTKFYQAHVDGKFRAADVMVAEDSKDLFFAADKPRCRAFQIIRLSYSENFSRAKAVVGCDTEMFFPGVGMVPLKQPLGSSWKILEGQWFWYVDPVSERADVVTPFGTRKAAPGEQSATQGGMPAAPVSLESLAALVKADKQELRFDLQKPATAQVTVTSQMPGRVTLSLEPAVVRGLEMKFDKEALGQGESAVLSVRYEPSKDNQPVDTLLKIIADPLQQAMPVQIRFSAPPTK